MTVQELSSYVPHKELFQLTKLRGKETKATSEQLEEQEGSLAKYIDHFDKNWWQEGLPRDWYNLKKKVGFSMDTQMNLLPDAFDAAERDLWLKRTERDTLAFCLEYLSDESVYPFQYSIQKQTDGSYDFIDRKYKKSMLSMVSDKERGGSVKDTLRRIQQFMVSSKTPDGALAIMPSPKGPSGLTTDDGSPISYPDSYWFVFMKDGEEVRGCTIKTDFDYEECRNAINSFTRKELALDVSLEDQVRAVAEILPSDVPWSPMLTSTEGILVTLVAARTHNKQFAFAGKTWSEVATNMRKGEELYQFNAKVQKINQEFKDYVRSRLMSKVDIRKALGATMLRLSKLFLVDEKQITLSKPLYADIEERRPRVTYGQVLDEVEKIPGCAGGGSTIVDSIAGSRLATFGVDQYGSLEFECPHCNRTNKRIKGWLRSSCQYCHQDVACKPKDKKKETKEKYDDQEYAMAA